MSRPILCDEALETRAAAIFANKERSRETFFEILWPQGLICRKCRGREFKYLEARDLYQCRRCRTQQSITAGTPLHNSSTDYQAWGAFLFYYTHPHLRDLKKIAAYFKIGPSKLRRWLIEIRIKGSPLYRLETQFLSYFYRQTLKR